MFDIDKLLLGEAILDEVVDSRREKEETLKSVRILPAQPCHEYKSELFDLVEKEVREDSIITKPDPNQR